ncbi:hypothetical protein [Rubritalea tangerina]|uniref:Uncharacterized protein n=1 Tax=Rubritalea tangerina TaxID=430798 RepID=A0ABW4Z7R8_9BACT
MKKILPILVVIAIVVGLKFYNKSKVSNEIKADATEQLQQELGPALGEEYVAELVDYAHPEAMEQAYKMGGKRSSEEFDNATYQRIFVRKILEKLQNDGKQDAASML